MAVNKKNIMTRYFFVVLLMGLVGIAIVVKGHDYVCRATVLARCSRPLRKRECNGEAQPGKYPVLGWQTDGKFAAGI